MSKKPETFEGYPLGQIALVHSACLTLATRVGDLMEDLVIIGGVAPSLLIPQEGVAEGHVGTLDLDVGLSVALLDSKRYQVLGERLRAEGFRPEPNEKGNPARQTWALEGHGRVTLDFLIPPSLEGDRGGRLRSIEPDFAAFIIPGLDLAFRDRRWVELSGWTLKGDRVTRSIPVCGPGSFVVLKALAFRMRGEPKDAYDLVYLLRFFGQEPVVEVAQIMGTMLDHPSTREALDHLAQDFDGPDAFGPGAYARFLGEPASDALRQDAAGAVRLLLRLLAGSPEGI